MGGSICKKGQSKKSEQILQTLFVEQMPKCCFSFNKYWHPLELEKKVHQQMQMCPPFSRLDVVFEQFFGWTFSRRRWVGCVHWWGNYGNVEGEWKWWIRGRMRSKQRCRESSLFLNLPSPPLSKTSTAELPKCKETLSNGSVLINLCARSQTNNFHLFQLLNVLHLSIEFWNCVW